MNWLPVHWLVKAAHEIDPDAKVGCMTGMNGVYPATCNPEDILNAQQAMHQKYWYVEVHARGHYPKHILKKFERKGYEIKADYSEAINEPITKMRKKFVNDCAFSICRW